MCKVLKEKESYRGKKKQKTTYSASSPSKPYHTDVKSRPIP